MGSEPGIRAGSAARVVPDAAAHARAEASFDAEVRNHLHRNYAAHLLHGLLGQTGFRLIHAPTFVPVYVHLISGSDLAVGAARAFQSLGMFLTPILGATVIESRRRVLPVGFVAGGLMRVQILGLALAGFFLSGSLELAAICLFLALFGFFLGIQGVVFNVLVSKVIPVESRGRLMGLRNALAGVTAGGVGLVGGRLVDSGFLGNGYASTFGLSFVLTSLGLAMLAFVREPASPRVLAQTPFAERLRQLPALLRSDRAFTLYFIARALGSMGRMAVPFYVLYAGTHIRVGGHELGLLTLAFVLAQSVGNLGWGLAADRRGFRVTFLASLGLWILSALMMMNASSLNSLVLGMVGLGGGLGGFMMSAQNMVLEFGEREDLPMRIAVANTASELVGIIGPLLGGVLSVMVSYLAVFWSAIVFQLAAIVLVVRFVDEPRHR